jgi:hypothetical protein
VSDPSIKSKITQKMAQSKAGSLGWEGVKREVLDADEAQSASTAAAANRNADAEESELEKSLAICLCVEGGPGTIGTVQV